MADWAVVLLTLTLVIVTGWYALLTRRLAESSERAARAAEASAASADAAAHATVESAGVQRAQAKPIFQTDPIGGRNLSGVVLRTVNGMHVIVHAVRLTQIPCWRGDGAPGQHGGVDRVHFNDESFPARVPTDGGWPLKFAGYEDGLDGCGRSDWYQLEVQWSFSLDGERSNSRVEFRPPGW